jgi:hypothetical protein
MNKMMNMDSQEWEDDDEDEDIVTSQSLISSTPWQNQITENKLQSIDTTTKTHQQENTMKQSSSKRKIENNWKWSAIDVDEENSKTLKLSIDGWLNMNKVPNERTSIDNESHIDYSKVAEARNGMIVVGVDSTSSVHFLTNWSDVWNADAVDTVDDFGRVAPLFRDVLFSILFHFGAICCSRNRST